MDKLAVLMAEVAKVLSDKEHKLSPDYSDCALWLKDGSPYAWRVVEEKGDLTALVEYGYGHMALFEGTNLIGWSTQHTIVTDKAVMVNVDYFGGSRYIFS